MDCGVRGAVLGPTHGWEGRGEVLVDTSNPGTRSYVIREDWSVSQETGCYIPKDACALSNTCNDLTPWGNVRGEDEK